MFNSSQTGTCGSAMAFATAKWTIFLILILTYILVYFHRMAPGVVSEYLMMEFQITGTQLGTLSAIYFFVYAFMQIPSGVLADTLGTRTSIISGNLTAGLGSLCFGLATSFEMACVGRFLVGLGVSVVFVAIMKNNSVWFEERVFGVMSGLTLLVGNLGSILAAGPLSLLLDHYTWRSIFTGIGAISIVLAILGFLVVRNRPEDLGFSAPNGPGNLRDGLQDSWMKNLLEVMRITRIWPGFWVQFGMVGGLYSFMGLWAIPFLRDTQAMDRNQAADYVTMMMLFFAGGALFLGWFSDKLGKRKPILLGSVLCYFGICALLMFSPWQPGLAGYILFSLMGFAGAGFVLTFACAKEIIHPELSGMAVSVVNTGCFIGTALMQPLFGWIADIYWDGRVVDGMRIYSAADYHHGFWAMLVFAAIAVLGALRVRETGCRNIYRSFS